MSGSALVFTDRLLRYVRGSDGVFINSLGQGQAVRTSRAAIHKPGFHQLVHDTEDSTGTVYVLYMISVRIRGYLTQARSLAG